MLIGQGLTGVNFQRYDDVRLVGLPISSNSTGMVHSEQMLTLDGPIRLGKSTAPRQRANRKPLEVGIAQRVHRAQADRRRGQERPRELEGRWIGELLPGQSAPTTDRMSALPADKAPFADERAAEGRLIQTRAAEPRADVSTRARSASTSKRAKRGWSPASTKCCPAKRSRPPPRKSAARRWSSPTCDYADRCRHPKKTRNTRRDIKADRRQTRRQPNRSSCNIHVHLRPPCIPHPASSSNDRTPQLHEGLRRIRRRRRT